MDILPWLSCISGFEIVTSFFNEMPLAEAVIVVLPRFIALTSPDWFTVAILASAVFQLILLSDGNTVGES